MNAEVDGQGSQAPALPQAEQRTSARPGLPLYVFSPSPRPFVRRLLWPFTKLGRVEHALVSAYHLAGDRKRAAAVERVAETLLISGKQGHRRTDRLLKDLLTYIAWSTIRSADQHKACHWLQAFDERFPAEPCRLPLRWQLMGLLCDRQDMASYQTQALLLFSDPLVTVAPGGESALQAATDVLYAGSSPATCAVVLDQILPRLREFPSSRTAIAISKCPPQFHSKEEAREWAVAVDPAPVSYSPRMHADSLIVLARVAEWEHDWSAMRVYAEKALARMPACGVAAYWQLRALLHLPVGSPARPPSAAVMPAQTPAWRRLQALAQIHQQPTVAEAESALFVLTGKDGDPDELERELLFDLVRQSFLADPPSTAAGMSLCARLCEAIRKSAGAIPWTELYIAQREVYVDGAYVAAYQRLEASEVGRDPSAQHLARAARILAGDAARPTTLVPHDGLAVVEWAMHQVLGVAGGPDQWPELAGLLDSACRGEVWAGSAGAKEVVQVLELAAVVLAGGEIKGERGVRDALAASALPWVRWLYARILLLVADPVEPAPLLSQVRMADGDVAWLVEGWISCRAVSACVPDDVEAQAAVLVDDALARLSGTERALADQLRRARKGGYREPAVAAAGSLDHRGFGPVGSLLGQVLHIETCLETEYAAARRALAEGKAAPAVALFGALKGRMLALPAVSRAWWLPVVDYWLGVTLAQAGKSDAGAEILERLVGGPKGMAARAQLALFCLRENRLDDASAWLGPVSDHLPAGRYARALLCCRRQDTQRAVALLRSPDAERIFRGSPYALAAQRLLAAIAERTRAPAAAETQQPQVLGAHPGDPVAAARLGRHLLHDAYTRPDAVRGTAYQDIEYLLTIAMDHETQPVEWAGTCLLLLRVLSWPPEQLESLLPQMQALHPERTGMLPWLQILARRRLEQRNTPAALALLDTKGDVGGPVWHQRAVLVLRLWSLLATGWRTGAGQAETERNAARAKWLARVRDYVDAIGALALALPRDAVLARYRALGQRALALGQAGEPAVAPAAWVELSPWPFAGVPALWSEDEKVRHQAAAELAAAVQSDACAWEADQVALLLLLSARVRGDDDAYLSRYTELGDVLGALPVAGPDLWLAAARIWFRRSDWKQLLESELPDCVAALELPEVRLIIGMAYARAAADYATRRDVRKAAQAARQAVTTLEGLVPESQPA